MNRRHDPVLLFIFNGPMCNPRGGPDRNELQRSARVVSFQ